MAPDAKQNDPGILSQLLLTWCFGFVRTGFNRTPTEEDTPQLIHKMRCQSIDVAKAEEQIRAGKSVFAAARACFPGWFGFGVTLGFVQGFLATVCRSLLLRKVVANVADGDVSWGEHAFWVAVLELNLIAEGISSTATRHWLADRLAHGYFSLCAVLIHRKSMRLSAGTSPASATSILGNDVVRTVENCKLLSFTPMGASGAGCGMVMVLWLTGMGGVVGMAVVLVLLGCNIALTTLVKRIEKKSLAAADQRLVLMKEIVTGIKAIKLSAWEEPFLNAVTKARDLECVYLGQYRLLCQTSLQVGRVCPIVGAASCFLYLGLVSEEWNAADVFAALSVWHAMRMGLIQLPQFFTQRAAAEAAEERVRAFLKLPELPALQPTKQDPSLPALSDASFTWGPETFTLDKLSVQVKAGAITAVVGAVGSGKSSLLLAMLGELEQQSGSSVSASGRIAFIPQTPVIVSGTLLENILMGRPKVQESLERAIGGAALGRDLALLPEGLQTQIGERGVMLSGGQQMRVTVARALYGDADILFADDALAAVDTEVAGQIFEHGFTSFVQSRPGRAAVLVLNQPHLFDHCDHLILMANGQAEELPAKDKGAWKAVVRGEDRGEEDPVHTSIAPEATIIGKVNSAVFWDYLRGMGHLPTGIAVVICICTYACMAGADRILGIWIQEPGQDTELALLYIILGLGFVLGAVGSSMMFALGGVRAGRTLHRECLQHVLRAPLSWFEQTPSGRITSRFSSDLANVDVFLPMYADNATQFAATLLALFALVGLLVPPLVAVIVLGLVVFGMLVHAVDKTNRECKRLANVAMAPVLTSVQEAGVGRVLFRTMCLCDFAAERLDVAVDSYVRLTFASNSVINFGMLCSYGITAVISCCTCIAILVDIDNYEESQAGLALSYAFTVPYFLLFFSYNTYQTKLYLSSLERLLQYKGDAVPQEPSWYLPVDDQLPPGWPAAGDVLFSNVSLKYRPELEPSIKDFSLEIQAGEKLGVIGRSGAGKSSLVQLLFRLRECSGGEVILNGQNCGNVGLQTMRRRMAVIPQESLVIAGDVRHNLDPFDDVGNEQLLKCVRSVGLARLGGEKEVLKRNASTLSAGEQQLVTFARALLRNVTLIVMDEPTSKVDPATDAQVQQVIRQQLAAATVIAIAHRLHTVIDYDRILVMGDGRLLECDTPKQLLADPNSNLSRLVEALGDTGAAELRAKHDAVRENS
mmetsp:Transcript_29963/g.77003  ORF Transcript_29963/g.77003 Transcript_29963/m.77003 type:complete len:1212 (+) Transcript_29963:29-3664(+)